MVNSRKALSSALHPKWVQLYKKHLRRARISGRRGTMTGAFKAAIVPYEEYSEIRVAEGISLLQQQSENLPVCVYCGKNAETLDHLFGVRCAQRPTPGHVVFNLVPCCHCCNVQKGKKTYDEYLEVLVQTKALHKDEADLKRTRLSIYCNRAISVSHDCAESSELRDLLSQYKGLEEEMLSVMAKADALAISIHECIARHHPQRQGIEEDCND